LAKLLETDFKKKNWNVVFGIPVQYYIKKGNAQMIRMFLVTVCAWVVLALNNGSWSIMTLTLPTSANFADLNSC
jgi:hypothetical protein